MNTPAHSSRFLRYRWLPFMKWLPQTNRSSLKADFIAGLTGSIVVLPQGVAFAAIAGMPPEYGLYAGMIPAIIAALFGSSRHLVSGPTTAASVVMFTALAPLAPPGSIDYVALALTLTLMVGLLELALGLAKMGVLVNFISHSVIVGFTAGAAVVIAEKQIPNFFGLTIESETNLFQMLSKIPSEGSLYVTSVALITLLSGIYSPKIFPKIPNLIVGLLVGSLVGVGLNHLYGESVTHIITVGALPDGLPPLSVPQFSLDTLRELAIPAFAVTLFALTEAVSIGRSMAARDGYRIDGNQEFIGQGLSNIGGAFFSGFVATGSFNRSAMNYQSGAKSPLAAVFAGVFLMGIVVAVAPLAAYLPKAVMAGLLFLVAWKLIDWVQIRHILKASKRESSVLLVTAITAVVLDLELAIFSGVILSLVLYMERTSKPSITKVAPNPLLPKNAFTTGHQLAQCPQLAFSRVNGSLFFGNLDHVQKSLDKIRDDSPEQKHLAILSRGINFVDLQGGEVLVNEARKRKEDNGGLYLISVSDSLWNSLEGCGCLDEMNASHVFQSKGAAIHGIYQKLDKSICAQCDKRIFKECGKKPEA